MHPELLGFSAWHALWALGALAGTTCNVLVLRSKGVAVVKAATALAIVCAFGAVGAKIEFGIENGLGLRFWLAGPGFRLPGGFLGAFVALPLILRLARIPVLSVLDAIVPGTALALGIGRIGCLLNGCCFGVPTSLPWGIQFPKFSRPYVNEMAEGLLPVGANLSLHVHPLQLYFSLGALAVGALLIRYRRRFTFTGEMFLLFLTIHEGLKAALEPLRGREYGAEVNRAWELDLIIAVAGLGALLFIAWVRNRARRARRAQPEFGEAAVSAKA